MTETASVLEAIGTTRSLRRFRPDPIPDELLRELLAAATCAPSGGNSQSWRFVVIRDPEQRRRVGALYKEGWDEYSPPSRLAGITDPRERRRVESAYHLGAHMGDEAPVLVLFCAPRPAAAGGAGSFAARTAGASVYPAVQNLLLAARARGIGGCLTTIHLYREEQVKATLGIPADVDTYALVPLGYPRDRFGPLRRKPVEEVAFLDRWGAPLARPDRSLLEQPDDAGVAVAFGHLPIADRGRGRADADHGRGAELARHDRAVAEHAAGVDDDLVARAGQRVEAERDRSDVGRDRPLDEDGQPAEVGGLAADQRELGAGRSPSQSTGTPPSRPAGRLGPDRRPAHQ